MSFVSGRSLVKFTASSAQSKHQQDSAAFVRLAYRWCTGGRVTHLRKLAIRRKSSQNDPRRCCGVAAEEGGAGTSQKDHGIQ